MFEEGELDLLVVCTVFQEVPACVEVQVSVVNYCYFSADSLEYLGSLP